MPYAPTQPVPQLAAHPVVAYAPTQPVPRAMPAAHAQLPVMPAGTPSPSPSPARPLALEAVTPRTTAEVETLSRHFLGISLRRAFRLQIKTYEVLPSERAVLEAQAGHITDPDHQAFLAWRRSVLLLVAIMFVPLTVFRFLESFDGPALPIGARIFVLMPAVAEAAFCVIAFDQLRSWAQWRRQRRILLIAWALYFAAPFLVYIYPFRSAFDSYWQAKSAAGLFGVQFQVRRPEVHLMVGLAAGVQALVVLGPKVISLMPGLIRASIVSKLLFPGSSAPGWLMILAGPLYALFAYIIILIPYQVTGSWHFVVGNVGLLGAMTFISLAGRRLTMPLTMEESRHRIHRSWLAYIGILVLSAGFMVYGLYEFIVQVHLGPVRVITGVLAFVANVLLDTLIGTDAIVAAMAYFRGRKEIDAERQNLVRETERKIDVFCS